VDYEPFYAVIARAALASSFVLSDSVRICLYAGSTHAAKLPAAADQK